MFNVINIWDLIAVVFFWERRKVKYFVDEKNSREKLENLIFVYPQTHTRTDARTYIQNT